MKTMCFIARASEFNRGKRTASYHVVITKEGTREKIALFEGLVYRFEKQIFKEEV
jgi:ribosomal protein L19